MKAYTDLEQSKKLAIFLPPDSADMEYLTIKKTGSLVGTVPFVKDDSEVENSAYSHTYNRIACWSLAALISILPDEIKHDGIVNNLWITSEDVSYYSKEYDSYLYYEEGCTVDACYEMILKLNELNLL